MKVTKLLLVLLALVSGGPELRAAASAAAPAVGGHSSVTPASAVGKNFQEDLARQTKDEAFRLEREAIRARSELRFLEGTKLRAVVANLERAWKKTVGIAKGEGLNLVEKIEGLNTAAPEVRKQKEARAEIVKNKHFRDSLRTLTKLLESGSVPTRQTLAAAIEEAMNASKSAKKLAETSRQVAQELSEAKQAKQITSNAISVAQVESNSSPPPLKKRFEAKLVLTGIERDSLVSLAEHAPDFDLVNRPEILPSSSSGDSSSGAHGASPAVAPQPANQDGIPAAPPAGVESP